MSTPVSSLRRPRSLFSLERMRSDRRVTWLTVAGILLVPLVIGGLLVWALWNPTERLSDVKAAVVNLDQPVTLNGQTVPLGRQLSAGLLNGKQDNFNWVLTDKKDAANGLADGSYVAVITIPKSFSKAATSPAGAAADATQATIDVQTSAQSKLVDPAISQAVTSTATGVLNKQLTSTYLQNVYVGFNILHDQISQAASGASGLAGGFSQLASGTHQLSDAASQLTTGASGLSSGMSQLSSGASSLSAGVSTLSTNLSGLAGGLNKLQSTTSELPAQTSGLATTLDSVGSGLSKLSSDCLSAGGNATFCADLAKQAVAVNGIAGTPGLAAGASALAQNMPALTGGIAQSASGASQLASGLSRSATGAAQLAGEAAQSASGAANLAGGVSQLGAGIAPLASGADQTAAGAATLASGLKTAAQKLPNYSTGDRTNLASVAAEPVTQKATSAQANGFGQNSIPLFAAVALWLGALATFLVLQAVSRRAILTTRASGRIALDGFVPAAAIGAIQGVLVTGIMQFGLSLDAGHWFGFAGVAMAAGVAFAAVNHGLVALFGGIGRFVSMLVVVITLASGIISTVPGFFDASMQWLPTSAAITAFRGVVESTDGVWRGLGGLLLWAGFGFVLALLAVARKRVVRISQLLPAE
ncbi:MAG: YhgE/Pip family protein [Leifsonia sp.]